MASAVRRAGLCSNAGSDLTRKQEEVEAMSIVTEAENDEALAIVESLMQRGEAKLTTEESALLDLLGTLIEQFESSAYPLPEGDPVGALEVLMAGRNMKPAELAALLGSRAKVSEILSRKRNISKSQAKRLAEFFDVSVAAFI
jgi:HTH-type transcriptional regulator/antitoxin HigA